MAKQRSKLPKTPSILIKMAMDDLNKIEKNDAYTIAMGSWHDTYIDHSEGSTKPTCHVCLAGTVMAHTLGGDKDHDLDPDMYHKDTKDRLLALDDFRIGQVGAGFSRMGLNAARGHTFDREIATYQFERRKFKMQMRKLIRDLKAARL